MDGMGNIGWTEILILLVGGGSFIIWVWSLIDCATNEPGGTDKIVWILVILLGGCIGAPIYLLVRRPRRILENGR